MAWPCFNAYYSILSRLRLPEGPREGKGFDVSGNPVHIPHATSIAFADYSLDQANNRTPQFSVADFRERPDQFHSVGGGEKIRDIGGRRCLCALTGVARDLRSASKKYGTGTWRI